MSVTNRKLAAQRNKLLRYQMILDEYHKHNIEDIPLTKIWRKYIYPKFAISKTTLYIILGTPVKKELEKVEHAQASQSQIKLF